MLSIYQRPVKQACIVLDSPTRRLVPLALNTVARHADGAVDCAAGMPLIFCFDFSM
jgi:hypothetical protein